MPDNLIPNPNYNPAIPVSGTNQPVVFENPATAVVNPTTGQTAANAAITADSLQPATPITLPVVPPDTTNYQGGIAGETAMSDAIAKQIADRAKEVKDEADRRAKESGGLDNLWTQFMGSSTAPPSLAGAYTSAGGTAPTGAELDTMGSQVITDETAVQGATDELNDLNIQMTVLNNEAKAIPERLQQEATGRGITAGGLAPIQTAQLRDIYLRQLPLSGQILIAQGKQLAAQGKANLSQRKLELAQGKFDRYFDLVVKDMENKYNYDKSLRDKAFEFATLKEQRQFDTQQKEADRKYQEGRDNLKLQQEWVAEAVKNAQGDLAAKISSLDPKDPNFQQNLSTLQSQIKIPDASVVDLLTKYPDAGILKTDDLTTATSKLRNSAIYRKSVKDTGTAPGLSDQLYSGLSGATATAVRGKVSKFASEPMVQNFATVQDGYNFANSLSTDTQNPADDQALIYSLAKALDPGSVVREGEYATAQKYAQSWIKAYGTGVQQAILGTGFLSKEARDNIKKTIEQKYTSTKKSYDNIYSQYQSGINQLTGRNDGKDFLIDYATPVSEQQNNEINLSPEDAYKQYQQIVSPPSNTPEAPQQGFSLWQGILNGLDKFRLKF